MSQRLTGLRPRVALTFAGILVGYSAAHAQSAGGSGKIPVTTSSAEAKRQYVKGRTLGENLRAHDSREFLTQAALIPNDPNPYDSYAELLMKMGRFDESIAMYRKALATDPHFANSRFGIASNLMYQGKHAEGRAELWKLYQAARNDGERRTALFGAAVIYADEGKLDQALAELKKEYAVAEKIDDDAAMAADLVAMGDVALEAGKPDDARKFYVSSLEMQEKSDLSSEVKEDAKLNHHYNLGRAALRAGDLAAAREHAKTFLIGATAKNNRGEILQAHELTGAIELQERKYDQALEELRQGNQQDPYTLYRLGLAYQGKGDQAKAADFFRQAANQHTLPTLNYAFVRAKARKMKA